VGTDEPQARPLRQPEGEVIVDGARGGDDEEHRSRCPDRGVGPRLGPGHMDAEDAAAAVALMRSRLVVPIHWGTFAPIGSSGRRLGHASEPAWAFVAHVADRAPSVVVRVLAARASRSPTREHHPTPPACTLAAAVAHRRTSRHAIFEVRPSRGARPPSNRQRGARRPHHAPPRPAPVASAAQRPVVAARTPAAAGASLISPGAGCRSGCDGSRSATIRPTSASAARTTVAST
jgi:hypothetical protein